MPNNLFQDMVKVKRMKKEESRPAFTPKIEEVVPEEKIPDVSMKRKVDRGEPRIKKGGRGFRGLWYVALISVIFFLFSLSFLFTKAEVTVSPKTKDFVSNENLTAVKDGAGGDLSFDLVVISGEENKTVQGGELKDVAVLAEGQVIIYNAFSSASQKLDIDTRLEGSNGKIYKTKKAVIVPGMKGTTPGAVEVGIYASGTGEGYNSGPLDFKIFGFKGTPKYAKFYARSKGDITGGFKGKLPTVSDADKVNLSNELKTNLENKLIKKATDQTPGGFILFKNAAFLHIDKQDFKASTDNTSLVATVSGTLYGILFDEKKLTAKIAKDNIENYDGAPVYIANIQDLIFSLSANTDLSNFNNLKNFNFSISGNTKAVWKVDETKLANDLAGKSKKNFNQILSGYPNIDSASLVLSPFWKMSLPGNSQKIIIVVNYPK